MPRQVSAADLLELGRDLCRPECVLGTPSGDVFVSDWRGGVTVVRADSSQQSWLARGAETALRPNGIALAPDGAFLLAQLGDSGGVWRLAPDGSAAPFVLAVDGIDLPPTNFVTVDRAGRMWISVSTRHVPRQRAWRPAIADGFIALVDDRGARIVADGLCYTNEVRPDPSGRWLYVVETFGRRLARLPILADAALGPRETVVEFGHGTFPDGFAFDEEGGVWITSLVSNRLLRFDGTRLETILEEGSEDYIRRVEAAFCDGTMTARDLGPIPGTRLQHVTSIAFGGVDRRMAYLGSLHGACVFRFRSPVAGVPEPHWAFPQP